VQQVWLQRSLSWRNGSTSSQPLDMESTISLSAVPPPSDHPTSADETHQDASWQTVDGSWCPVANRPAACMQSVSIQVIVDLPRRFSRALPRCPTPLSVPLLLLQRQPSSSGRPASASPCQRLQDRLTTSVPVCPFTCHDRGQLTSHGRQHVATVRRRLYACDHCSYAVDSLNALLHHQRLHSQSH